MRLSRYIELFRKPFHMVTLYNCRSHYPLFGVCNKSNIHIFHHGYYAQLHKPRGSNDVTGLETHETNSKYPIGHGFLDLPMLTSYIVGQEQLQPSMDLIKQKYGVSGFHNEVKMVQRYGINTLEHYANGIICNGDTISDKYAEYPPKNTFDNYLSKYDSTYYYVCILGGENYDVCLKKLFKNNNCEFLLDEEHDYAYDLYSGQRYYVHKENLKKSINLLKEAKLVNDSFDIYEVESKENRQKRIDDFYKFFSAYNSPPVKVGISSRINKTDVSKIHAFNNMHQIYPHIYNYTTDNAYYRDAKFNGMSASFYVAEEKYNEVEQMLATHIGAIVPCSPFIPMVSGQIDCCGIGDSNCEISFHWHLEKLVRLENIQ